MDWLARIPLQSLHAIVTDPPFGIREFENEHLDKMSDGSGGVWRQPPTLDGCKRSPVPRFTAMSPTELSEVRTFFASWSRLAMRALRPGGHIIVASSVMLSQVVFGAIVEGGLEFRGQIVRTVRTLRGGDRPKGAEAEFPDVSVMPRGLYEPWGIFRAPLPKGMTVAACLREFGTGGLRRQPDGRPFEDIIESSVTSAAERAITGHPNAKPQALMRRLVYASLPLGTGVVVDPFSGSGSTVAAAEAVGYQAVGVERNQEYFDASVRAVPRLAGLEVSR